MWASYVVVMIAVAATAIIFRLRGMPSDRWSLTAMVVGVMVPCLTTLVLFVVNRSWYLTWPVAAVLLLLSLTGLGLMLTELRRSPVNGEDAA